MTKRISVGSVGIPLALALLPHYSCSKEPIANKPPITVSQEELTAKYFQDQYNVALAPGFDKETLAMFNDILQKAKSKYGDFFNETEIHIRPPYNFEHTFTESNMAAYAQAREVQFHPKARELLLKAGLTPREITMLKFPSLPDEEFTRFDKMIETLNKEEREYLGEVIKESSLAENSLLVYPAEMSEDNSGSLGRASWTFAHELGHILTKRNPRTFTRIQRAFNQIHPYGIEEAVSDLPNPRKTDLSNTSSTMVEHLGRVMNAVTHKGQIPPEFNSYYPASIHLGLVAIQGLDRYIEHYTRMGRKDAADAFIEAKKSVIGDLGSKPTEIDLLDEDSAEIFAQTIIGPEFKTRITQEKGRVLEEILEEEYSD